MTARRRPSWFVLVLGALLAVGILGSVADSFFGGGGGDEDEGAPGSSYTTSSVGLAAYADLLGERGHDVERVRTSLDDADLDLGGTLIVSGDGVRTEDVAIVRSFVVEGGRLVLIGPDAVLQHRDLTGGGLVWTPAGVRAAAPLALAPESARVSELRGSTTGAWTDTGGLLPLVGTAAPTRVLVAVGTVGAGRVVAIADEGVLQNRLLDEADNAALGLDVAGPEGRPVRFAEAHLGHGGATGFSAIPSDWRWLLGALVVTTLLGFWVRGKRFGPPQRTERALAPARAEAVRALAATLHRSGDSAVVAGRLRVAGRDRLARRVGLPADADPAILRAAGQAAGLSTTEVDALVTDGPPHDLLTTGSALARTEGD